MWLTEGLKDAGGDERLVFNLQTMQMKHCLSVYSTGATVFDVFSRAIHYCCLVYSDLFELIGRFSEESLTIYKMQNSTYLTVCSLPPKQPTPFDSEWMSLQQDSGVIVFLLNYDLFLLSWTWT